MAIDNLIKRLNENDPTLKSYKATWFDSMNVKEAIKLADALKKNKVLTSLTFENMRLCHPKIIQPIAEALKENTQLKSLSFIGCYITNEGSKAIVDALNQNNTLTALTIHSRFITNDTFKNFKNALEKNTTLTSLTLRVMGHREQDMIDKIPSYQAKIQSLLNKNQKMARKNSLFYSVVDYISLNIFSSDSKNKKNNMPKEKELKESDHFVKQNL